MKKLKAKPKRLIEKEYRRKSPHNITAVQVTEAALKNVKLFPKIFWDFIQELNKDEALDSEIGFLERYSGKGLWFMKKFQQPHLLRSGDFVMIMEDGSLEIGDPDGFYYVYEEVK